MSFTPQKRKEHSKMILDDFASLDTDYQSVLKKRNQNVDDYINELNEDGDSKQDSDAKLRKVITNTIEFFNTSINEIINLDNYIKTDNSFQQFLNVTPTNLYNIITRYKD
ncbi:MAG: hypothetical protein LBF97_04515, partial [Elusimicrobiota bacterium]|nr:hypothetical protein [Elusimicrobiota bacterium]